jgi:drug/metabolite transporter (DMT)-like permease
MGFSTVAMKFVSVAEGALIIYTMPIWAMLFAWPFLHVRPTARDVIALILGLAGVALLLGATGYSLSSGEVIGDVLSLACAMLFALGNVLNRKPLPMPPLVAVAWQVGLGCLAMLILGLVFEHPNYGAISPIGWACFVYMTLVSMGVCYLTWFETLRRHRCGRHHPTRAHRAAGSRGHRAHARRRHPGAAADMRNGPAMLRLSLARPA